MSLVEYRAGYRLGEEGDPEFAPSDYYPVELSVGQGDKRETRGILYLPYRAFPEERRAISLLMTTQANFKDMGSIYGLMVENVGDLKPDVIVGIPTLGLPIAEHMARRLGHNGYVPLSNTHKFWQGEGYGPELMASVASVTSPDEEKHLYLDPYLLERMGGVVMVVDDVTCFGGSLVAGLMLALKAKEIRGESVDDVYAEVILTEGRKWQQALASTGFDWENRLRTLGNIPMFMREYGRDEWVIDPESL